MRLRVLIVVLALAAVPAMEAQNIYTTVNLSGWFTLNSSGTASYRNSWGNLEGHSMGGWLAIGPCLQSSGFVFWSTGYSGTVSSWSGSVSCASHAGECHQGRIEAESNQTPGLKQGAGSSHICIPPPACLDANSNGICDNQETIDKDPNQDSCPGGAPCSSPVVIKLAAGPWRFSGVDDPVAFDIDADGVPNQITWTARESLIALLALDRNGNGSIDSGAELFGNWTPLASGGPAANGFEALEELDSNADGVVSSLDSGWSRLLLWVDENHDGVSQATELQSVTESMVESVETDHHWTGRRDAEGNYFGYQSRARIGGRPRVIYDVYFRAIP